MTDNKTFVLDTMRRFGESAARDLQQRAPEMTGTAIYGESGFLPAFNAAKQYLNYKAGYVCVSAAGRAVKLLQPYDSTVYTGQPEDYPSLWGFYWSTDPAKALPFIALSTSPYMIGDCCTEGGHVWRSTIDNNVWAPSAYPTGWTDLGVIGAVEEPEQPDPAPEPEPEPEEPEPTGYPDFVQPTGAHDAYQTGDIVKYNGQLYESTIDNNVWSPDTYPQGWKLYTEG